MIRLAFNVAGDLSDLPTIHCDSGYDGVAVLESPSRLYFDVPFGQFGQFTLHFDGQEVRSNVPPIQDGSALEGGLLTPPIPELRYRPRMLVLPAAHVEGIDFKLSDGSRFVVKGATNFLSFAKSLRGGAPRIYRGSNMQRFTVTMVNIPQQAGMEHTRPENYPDFWGGLDRYTDALQAAGSYGYMTILCDVQLLHVDDAWVQRVYAQACEVVQRKPWIWVEGINEFWNNGFDPARLPKPQIAGLWTAGSIMDAAGGEGFEASFRDRCDFLDIHPRRDFPKMIQHQSPCEASYQYGKPVLIGEPFKAGEGDIPNKQYTNPDFFRRGAKLAAAWNGAVFHSDAGCFSNPLGPVADGCRGAFYEGLA